MARVLLLTLLSSVRYISTRKLVARNVRSGTKEQNRNVASGNKEQKSSYISNDHHQVLPAFGNQSLDFVLSS